MIAARALLVAALAVPPIATNIAVFAGEVARALAASVTAQAVVTRALSVANFNAKAWASQAVGAPVSFQADLAVLGRIKALTAALAGAIPTQPLAAVSVAIAGVARTTRAWRAVGAPVAVQAQLAVCGHIEAWSTGAASVAVHAIVALAVPTAHRIAATRAGLAIFAGKARETGVASVAGKAGVAVTGAGAVFKTLAAAAPALRRATHVAVLVFWTGVALFTSVVVEAGGAEGGFIKAFGTITSTITQGSLATGSHRTTHLIGVAI